uniref:RRM domain-containing protein n=2 Tax=Craspedostauros australis TaxID=1486917 RepID=A0A7R9WRH9_9STRA|mmetsp:Transcript_15552/g.42979  ORF Transcript_15552/g.42979 Transcript_15552/m.42979 type:complete len:202 (+) Transcript_15552:324-929(+)
MTEAFLTDFLGNAMEQVGLNTKPGNPIAACRVSGKFAFIELRSPQEAANALNLNNIPCMGAYLRIGRPSKWSGTPDTHGNWEDILAKYMSGELQVGAAASSSVTTRVVELHNMLTSEDLEDENEYNEIMEDTRAECGQFGTLKSIVIPKANEPGATKIFLEYESPDDAAKAIQNLAGRTFDGRKVAAAYFDEGKFASKQFA